ncbi:related to transporter protein HOL1 [Cephalotrichum gorgonifer]|uniref:Related to transporter protein HOL1 n=1 Tax=Cephalotrichum gorgonifer TaxID=2041049 RepID=A0AAE8MRD9_9PEZI|nr:related to transporter protein HOL1 [Cephalotrichum gorgonifer]
MPMGILQSRSLDHVPGTTRYFDDPERPQIATGTAADDAGLKCDRSGPVPIILVPQPSDDPNDPLNWPLWRRDLITFILSMTAIFATSLGSILASNTMVMTALFTTTFTKVALMTGYFLLGVGGAAVFFVPSARVWGKRHALIIGLVFLIFSSAWGGAARDSRGRGSYDSFVAARAVQGIGCAPYETLVNAAVSDLYFVHQRGLRMAFTNLAVFGGAFFTPIVVGKITHEIGWWWSFNLISIFCAVCLPAVFFFCPEMAYRRDAALNTDLAVAGERRAGETADGEQQTSSSSAELRVSEGTEKAPDTPPTQPQSTPAGPENTTPPAEAVPVVGDGGPTTDAIPAKKTFIQSLALVDGRKTDDAYWRLLLRPFALIFHPAFLWACLTQGTMIGWTVFIGAIIASIFSAPPYYWDEVKNGYSYTGPFLGALAGFGLAGLLADWSAKFMTKRNGGVYEPEFRIVLVAPMAVLGCAGLYGFGITASQLITGRYHWSVPVAFFGLQVAGMVVGTVSSSLYIVDAYRDLAIEGFTMMIIFKNFFSFVLTFYAFDWVTTGLGIRDTMTIIASIQVAVCLTSIPMYIYGKKMRALSHRRDLLRALNLR